MARGHQKEQSRQKNAKKAATTAKSKGTDQRTAAAAALHYICHICRIPGLTPKFSIHLARYQTQVPDPKTYKQHFENKHPKNPLPPECLQV